MEDGAPRGELKSGCGRGWAAPYVWLYFLTLSKRALAFKFDIPFRRSRNECPRNAEGTAPPERTADAAMLRLRFPERLSDARVKTKKRGRVPDRLHVVSPANGSQPLLV